MRGALTIGLLLGQSVPSDVVDSAGLEISQSLEQPPALFPPSLIKQR